MGLIGYAALKLAGVSSVRSSQRPWIQTCECWPHRWSRLRNWCCDPGKIIGRDEMLEFLGGLLALTQKAYLLKDQTSTIVFVEHRKENILSAVALVLCVSVIDADMQAVLVLLSLLLSESLVATLARRSGKRRAYYKPASVESMSWFVDTQKVCHWVLFGIAMAEITMCLIVVFLALIVYGDWKANGRLRKQQKISNSCQFSMLSINCLIIGFVIRFK